MDAPSKAWVVGAINPLARGPSVLIPVLSDRPGGNAYFLQTLDADGQVSGFQPTPIDAFDRSLRDDAVAVAIGDEPLWGLTFPAGDSRVAGRSELDELLRRRRGEFEEQTLALLGMARVLWPPHEVQQVLRTAWERLQLLNPSGAQTWRRSVAVPGALRSAIEGELRRAGITPSRRDLAGIVFDVDSTPPRLAIPQVLFHDLAEVDGAWDRIEDEAGLLARAVDLDAPSVVIDTGRSPRPQRLTSAGDGFPATIWGIGTRGAELARLMGRTGAEALADDEVPDLESRFGEPAFPTPNPDIQVVAHPDPDALVSRISSRLVGRLATAERPQERYGVVVFNASAVGAEAAQLLSFYLQTEGIPAIGVLLEPRAADVGSRTWLTAAGSEQIPPDLPLLFILPDLQETPGAAVEDLRRLLLLLRATGAPSGILEALSALPKSDHARLGSVSLRPGEAAQSAIGRCMARLRNAASRHTRVTRMLAMLEMDQATAQAREDYADALLAGLANHSKIDSPMVVTMPSTTPSLTLAALDLERVPVTPEGFEAVCQEILEDLGCEVGVEHHGPSDFMASAPGVLLFVDARHFELIVPAEIVRVVSSPRARNGRRLFMTSGISPAAQQSLEADDVDVVDYRDIDRLESILAEEHARFFRELQGSGDDYFPAMLETYEHHVIKGCGAKMWDFDPHDAEVDFEEILWEPNADVGRVQARVRYRFADGDTDRQQTLIVSFVIRPEGPGPIQIHASLKPPGR